MKFFIIFLLINFSLCSGTKIKGLYDHCTKEFCEIINEVELVTNFEKCTKLPIVKFFSHNLKKIVPAVLDMVDGAKKLFTNPQEEINCERKTYNRYKDFDIIREGKTASVIFNENPEIENSNDDVNLINPGYFERPVKFIIKDFVIIAACLIIIVIVLIKLIKCVVRAKISGKSLKCCVCVLGFILAKLIAKNRNEKDIDEEKHVGFNISKSRLKKPEKIKNTNEIVASELITEDEDESSANYSHLNRVYFTPDKWPVITPIVANHHNTKEKMTTPSLPNVQKKIIRPSAPYQFPPEFMRSMLENFNQSSPISQSNNLASNQAHPSNHVSTMPTTPIASSYGQPQQQINFPYLNTQNFPSTAHQQQTTNSPPFSAIRLIPGNDYAPCPIPNCTATKTFKGSKGIKMHANNAHPNYIPHFKNGEEGFIPK